MKLQRLRRARRLTSRKVWRSLLLGLTEPENDPHWRFVVRRDTRLYLEDPEPWLAPGAANLILRTIEPGWRVFEWGAGASTLWMISHGLHPISVETDAEWVAALSRQVNAAGELIHLSKDAPEYVTPNLAGFRMVLIDGRRRRACALHVASDGRPGQIVVFDDSHRTYYRDGVQALSERASHQWHFAGLSPEMTPKMTSIFQLT